MQGPQNQLRTADACQTLESAQVSRADKGIVSLLADQALKKNKTSNVLCQVHGNACSQSLRHPRFQGDQNQHQENRISRAAKSDPSKSCCYGGFLAIVGGGKEGKTSGKAQT